MPIFGIVHLTTSTVQRFLTLIGRASILILPLTLALGGDHNWTTGKVLDSAVSRDLLATSIASQAHFTGTARSLITNSSVDRTTFWDKQIVIQGGSYWYAVDDLTLRAVGLPLNGLINRAVANRKHGCRMVVGDPIQYAQEKGKLFVLDADGKECKLDIIRQERIAEVATASLVKSDNTKKLDPTVERNDTVQLDDTAKLASTIVSAAPLTKTSSRSEKRVPLHDADILKLVKAGFSEQMILAKIQSSPGMYELGTDDLWRLKAAGVSENVMIAMMSTLQK